MRNFFKKLFLKNKEESDDTPVDEKVEKLQETTWELESTLAIDLTSMTEHHYKMIKKRNHLSLLPSKHPDFLQKWLDRKWKPDRPTILGVDTPLPNHYEEMTKYFSPDFDWFTTYAKAKKLSWVNSKDGELE